MPDDLDHVWLEEFIDDARNWSENDVATATFHLESQKRAVAETDERDVKTRETLQGVVDRLERAIRQSGR